MISLKKHNSGFTIVELLIVIVVIGILALLVITTYSGIQAKARNSKRSSDVSTIQTQLEAFFQNSGYYPSLGDMNSTIWLKHQYEEPGHSGAWSIRRQLILRTVSRLMTTVLPTAPPPRHTRTRSRTVPATAVKPMILPVRSTL